jgi:hypothetical protein
MEVMTDVLFGLGSDEPLSVVLYLEAVAGEIGDGQINEDQLVLMGFFCAGGARRTNGGTGVRQGL